MYGYLPYIGLVYKPGRGGFIHMPAKMERLEARINRSQKTLFQRAARLEGRSLSDFVVAATLEAAARTIQRDEILQLSTTDRDVFVRALLNPPEPVPALREAARRYKKLTR